MSNIQGDIVAITDSNGCIVAEYLYDSWGKLIFITGSLAGTVGVKNPYRYRGYYYDTETGLYYLNSRYYDPAIKRFINADEYVSTGQGLLGNNMFAYCINNPIRSYDPSGKLTKTVNKITEFIQRCKSFLNNSVLVISNKDSAWMESSKIMGNSLRSATKSNFSLVKSTTTENFAKTWNKTKSSYVIIHTHGSPDALQGEDFEFTTSKLSDLQVNSNIKLVIITACSVGGDNKNKRNLGQQLSTKISSDGVVICSTTVVSGGSAEFTATDGGEWVVYQNGTQIPADLPTTITMNEIAEYWKSISD